MAAKTTTGGDKRRRASRKAARRGVSLPIIANKGEEIAYRRALAALSREMVVTSGKKMLNLYRDYLRRVDEGADVAALAESVAEAVSLELATMWDVYSAKFAAEGEDVASAMVLRQARIAVGTARKAVKEAMTAETGGAGAVPPVEVLPPSAGALPPPGGASGGVSGGIMSIPGDAIPPEIAPVMKAAITENVNLIKSIPPQYLDRIAGAVTRSMQAGGSTRALVKEIQRYGKMTLRRADNIARDQVHKAFENINIAEFKRLGIRKFRWMHTGGSTHPRWYHLDYAPKGLNQGIFDIDDPPVIDQRTGERGFPGQLPFCRCTMCAVVEWD